MSATGIPSTSIDLFWPQLWAILQPAYEKSDEKPTETEILSGIRARTLQAWAVFDKNVLVAGICTKLLVVGDRTSSASRHCHLWLVSGCSLSSWVNDFLTKLIPWAKSEGCSAITGNGRPGWDRIVRKCGGYRTEDRNGQPCWRLDI